MSTTTADTRRRPQEMVLHTVPGERSSRSCDLIRVQDVGHGRD